MRNDNEPRRHRIGDKKQHEPLIKPNGTTMSWEELDKLPSFWEMGPEKMINSYEQFFEAALIRLGLPIVGVSMFEEEEQRLPEVPMLERRRLAKEFILGRLRLANEFIREHGINTCYNVAITKIFLQYKENKPSSEGETKGVAEVSRSERREEEEKFIRKLGINTGYIGLLEKFYPEYEEDKPLSEGGTKGMPEVPMLERRRLAKEFTQEIRLLANEFIRENDISTCYNVAITKIFLQYDEGKQPSGGMKIDNLPLVEELTSKAAPANDYESARQAARALFEARQVKSSLKDGNESSALVRALVLVSRASLFVVAEMQLGYLSGVKRSASMAESNIDAKNARAERKEQCWTFYQDALKRKNSKNNAYKITAKAFNEKDEEKYKGKCKAEYKAEYKAKYKSECKITDNDFNNIYKEKYKEKYKELSHETIETYMKEKEKEEATKKEERL